MLPYPVKAVHRRLEARPEASLLRTEAVSLLPDTRTWPAAILGSSCSFSQDDLLTVVTFTCSLAAIMFRLTYLTGDPRTRVTLMDSRGIASIFEARKEIGGFAIEARSISYSMIYKTDDNRYYFWVLAKLSACIAHD